MKLRSWIFRETISSPVTSQKVFSTRFSALSCVNRARKRSIYPYIVYPKGYEYLKNGGQASPTRERGIEARKQGANVLDPHRPPSVKPAIHPNSQNLRLCLMLLYNSPLVLVFQHNNLTSVEWFGVRECLHTAMALVDSSDLTSSRPLANEIKFTVMKKGILVTALRLLGHYRPPSPSRTSLSTENGPGNGLVEDLHSKVMETAKKNESTMTRIKNIPPQHTHYLSEFARDQVRNTGPHPLSPLLVGPLVLLPFPEISPSHLAMSLRILNSNKEFVRPKKSQLPSLYDPVIQSGISKLMLVGGQAWEWRPQAQTISHEVLSQHSTVTDPTGIQSSINSQNKRTKTPLRVVDVWDIEKIAHLRSLEMVRGELINTLSGVGTVLTHSLNSIPSLLLTTLKTRQKSMELENK